MNKSLSLAAVFCILTYAALTTMAIAYPLSAWNYVEFYLWVVVMLYAIRTAVSGTSRATFAMGFVLANFTYVAATWMESDFPTTAFPVYGEFVRRVPHRLLFDLFIKLHGGEDQFAQIPDKLTILYALNRVAIVNTSLLFGMLGGALVSWKRRASYGNG